MDRFFRVALLIGSWLVAAGPARANTCVSQASGNWTAPSTWADCGFNKPQPADSVVISPGHEVLYDENTLSGDTVAGVTVDGTLRFPAGDHRLQVSDPDARFVIEGTVEVANGSVIAFAQTSGSPGFSIGVASGSGSFVSDSVDIGPLREASNVTVSAASGVCVTGDRWVVTSPSDLSLLVPGDIVQFAAGAAMGRMYEVVSIAGPDLTLCPEFPDAASLGPRLTPHAPTAATYQPGDVPDQVPSTGDTFWAWHPWRIEKVGTLDWLVTEKNQSNAGRWEWIGGDFSGYNRLALRCAASRPPVILAHNNFHEYTHGIQLTEGSSGDGGCDRPLVVWNVMHDGVVPNNNIQLAILRLFPGSRVTGGVVAFNTFYRTDHNNISINAVGQPDPVEGFDVAYNTGFELGASASGECEFIEIDVMADTVVEFNRAWRMSPVCGGVVAKPSSNPGAFKDNIVRGNYLQGPRLGIGLSTSGQLYPDNYALDNFISDAFRQGISAYVANGNVVRRWSEGNASDGSSNLFGIETHHAESNLLDGGGSVRAVFGFKTDNDPSFAGKTRAYQNNLCRGFGSGQALPAVCVFNEDNATDQYDLEVLHNVVDCGSDPDCQGVVNLQPGWNPPGPATALVADNVVIGVLGFGVPATTQAGSNVTDVLENLTRFPLSASPASGTWSTQVGEVARDPLFVDPDLDWNYLPGSLEWGAGSYPPGSPVGIRSRTFDSSLFPSFLLGVMAVPADTLNEAIPDAEGDGIPDQEDNCPRRLNTFQEDGDLDGVGDACDNCPQERNASQSDRNQDGQGDACDLDDGWILLSIPVPDSVEFQQEPAYEAFNLYRGDLSVLLGLGIYTQDPGTVALAERNCGVGSSPVSDDPDLLPGEAVFYLVTGVAGGVEMSLGLDSQGLERFNHNPCP